MKHIEDELRVKPGGKIRLNHIDPAGTCGIGKNESAEILKRNLERLDALQDLLYADRRHALLIVLQALDAGGKDGTIKHVMSGMNPQGCQVTSFKVPTEEEREHDYLWRVHRAVPRRGMIGIFNRSHYEDVLVVRVHKLVEKEVWKKRYEQINDFERMLSENRVRILKFYLHISKDEQKRRFTDRVKDARANWKISLADYEERKHWDDYRAAYEDALSKCSTASAPWYVIPSDRKWFRNIAVSSIIIDALESMKLAYPKPSVSPEQIPAEFGGSQPSKGTKQGGAA